MDDLTPETPEVEPETAEEAPAVEVKAKKRTAKKAAPSAKIQTKNLVARERVLAKLAAR